MRLLSSATIEQALGRAAMIFELDAIEQRIEGIMERADSSDVDREFAEVLNGHRTELLATLWGPDEPEPTIAEEIEALTPTDLGLAIRELLRRHPEISPPDEDLSLDDARLWLLERINRLPREERESWRP